MLILVVFHVPASSYSNSTMNSREFTFTNNLLKLATKDEPKLRSEHPLANAWMINSAIGVIGTFFNSFELFVFYRERHQMINSVNVMIWSVKMLNRMSGQFLYLVFRMDTFYRVLYSFLVQWRCYNLSFDQNLLRKTFFLNSKPFKTLDLRTFKIFDKSTSRLKYEFKKCFYSFFGLDIEKVKSNRKNHCHNF